MTLEEKYTIKQLRGLRGMTQEELALKTGISANTISDYEIKSKRLENAKYKNIKAIANVLGVEIEDIKI